jgi:hypothetical protein
MIAVNFRPQSEQFFKVQLTGAIQFKSARGELQGLCGVNRKYLFDVLHCVYRRSEQHRQ